MFKFVEDNVDRKMVVRDIRSDHHGELHHMYSILAVKGRIEPPSSSQDFNCSRLSTIPTDEQSMLLKLFAYSCSSPHFHHP